MKFWTFLICSTLLCGGLPVLLGGCTASSTQPTTDANVHATIQTISNPTSTSTPNVTMKQYDNSPKITVNPDSLYIATIEMEKGGKIVIDLFSKEAPVTVNNFIFLSRDGYYDGVTFHRVIPGFMAQSGDPTGSGTGGPGYTIPDEFSPLRRHDGPGVLSMANTGRPNSGGGQWFITFVATPHLDDAHTVFGKVTSGMEVVQKITVRDPGSATSPGDVIKTINIEEIKR